MTDLRITQQARRMVDFEELVAAIRLAAKSAIRNPEWVPMRERNSPRGVFGRTERLNSGPTSQRIWDEANRRPW